MRFIQALGQEQVAASNQLIEAADELFGHLPGIAVEHDGNPVRLGKHEIKAV